MFKSQNCPGLSSYGLKIFQTKCYLVNCKLINSNFMPNNLIKLHLQGMKKMVFPYMYLKRLTKVHIFLKKA